MLICPVFTIHLPITNAINDKHYNRTDDKHLSFGWGERRENNTVIIVFDEYRCRYLNKSSLISYRRRNGCRQTIISMKRQRRNDPFLCIQ